MPHVLVSYVHENEEEVQRLCNELTQHGVKVWLNRNDIKPGSRWKDAIRESIQQGDFFIACFSEQYRSRDKNYMNEELTLAIEVLRQYPADRTWFIPVLLSECDVPVRSIGGGETLIDIQWVALYTDWDVGIKTILDVIQPTPPYVQNLMDALRSDDDEVRIVAAKALADFAPNAAVPSLIEALKDENHFVRLNAAFALGNIGGPKAVSALIEALKDKDHLVLSSAAYALGNIGEPAIPSLIEALKDKINYVRRYAASALGNIGGPKAVSALIEALKDKDHLVLSSAYHALINIGEPAIPSLIEALKDKINYVRRVVADALKEIGTPEALKAVEEYKKQKKET